MGLSCGKRIMLDLGRVKNFAEMTVKLTPSMSGGKTPHDVFPVVGKRFSCGTFSILLWG